MDGKGLIAAMLIAILTADLYCYMRKREFGKISLPDTVPASLSDVFASIVPGAILLLMYTVIFMLVNAAGTTLPKLIYREPLCPVAESGGQSWIYVFHHIVCTYILVLWDS